MRSWRRDQGQRKALNEVEAFRVSNLPEIESARVNGEDVGDIPDSIDTVFSTNTWLHIWDNMIGDEITGFGILK